MRVLAVAVFVGLAGCGSSSTPSPPPAHAQVQAFHGTGEAHLGTVVIPAASTIRWRRSGGGIFTIMGVDRTHHRLMAVDPSTSQMSGSEAVSAGTYSDVAVFTGDRWSFEVIPDR